MEGLYRGVQTQHISYECEGFLLQKNGAGVQGAWALGEVGPDPLPTRQHTVLCHCVWIALRSCCTSINDLLCDYLTGVLLVLQGVILWGHDLAGFLVFTIAALMRTGMCAIWLRTVMVHLFATSHGVLSFVAS